MDNENKEFNQDFEEQAPRAEALKEAEEAEEARVRAAEERGEGAEAAAEMEAEESVMRDVRIVSPTALVLKRFFRSRLSLIGLAMFVVLFIFVFVGPLFVGWGETEVDYSGGEVNIQRTDVTFVGPDGEEYTIVQVNLSQTQINRLAGVFSHGVNAEGETVLHILGTDSNGMDVFARLMYGGRVSLTISFMAVILNTLLGIVMGGLAGYFGKWVDMLIMRIVDVINCVPTLPIMLIFSAILDEYAKTYAWMYEYRLYIIMGLLTLISWTGTARLVRGQTFQPRFSAL